MPQAASELAELLYELSERTESGLLFGGVGDDEDGVEGVQIACRTEDLHAQHADARGHFRGGFSGVAFGAGVPCITGMAQGCVPLGEGLEITEARGALVTGLDGDPALQRLLQLLGVELEGSDWQPALTTVRTTLAAIAPPGRARPRRADRRGPGADPGWPGPAAPGRGCHPGRGGRAFGDLLPPPGSGARARNCCNWALLRDAAEPERAAPEGEHSIRGAIYISCRGRGGGCSAAPMPNCAPCATHWAMCH
jgi:hypothetical protein